MDATRIIAIRHGETDWNVDARIQGQLDIPLNETGHWQARRLSDALASEGIAAIYSSDLKRAHETALAVGRGAGVGVNAQPGLRERRFGLFEGRTFGEVAQQWPEHARHWRDRLPNWEPPQGGESLLDLRERVARNFGDLAARHRGAHIAVVTHGGVLDALYRIATGQEINTPRTWELPNCAINRLLWTPDGFTLVGWSDTQHLGHGSHDEITAL